jgi:L-serine/L-threonine ammonia-lyase
MTITQPIFPHKGVESKIHNNPPWINTPCIVAESLSAAAGCEVFAKLDLLQPSGSFKSRGIGNFIWESAREFGSASRPLHFFSCSRGNAGIAAAMAARKTGQRATVVVPELTDVKLRARIEAAGAKVIVHGESLSQADRYARAAASASEGRIYVSPFDHEKIWQGNSTIIDEIVAQWEGPPPDAIVCSVGGGGLLNGIMLGLDRHGWMDSVTVLAVETDGADCLSQAVQAGEQVTLPKITSIAKSLGVTRVSSKTLDFFIQQPTLRSVVLDDAEAARACVRFANDEKMMVEPACGVSLAVCYNGILNELVPNFNRQSRVIVIVCGGSNIDLKTLQEYDMQYGSHSVGF